MEPDGQILSPSQRGGCWAGNKDVLTRSEDGQATDEWCVGDTAGSQTAGPEWMYYGACLDLIRSNVISSEAEEPRRLILACLCSCAYTCVFAYVCVPMSICACS